MDFEWPEHVRELRDEAEALAREWAPTEGAPEDSWIVGYSREFSRELGRRGWLGMTWPVEEGGHGASALERFVVAEALIGNGAPVAASWFADRQIGPVLLAFGTAEQRRRFLPSIVDGSTAWCIGMSEPDAGSDLASVATRARRDGDEWVVSGAKVWTSFANVADWCYLICRTGRQADRHRGLSELIVDMSSPGIEVRPIRDMTGGTDFCEITFDEVRVPVENLVGEEGNSFKQVMRQLEYERGGIDRLVSNHTLYRDWRPRAELSDPTVRQEVAELESGYRVGRLLVLRQVLEQAPPVYSAVTKTWCTEFEQRVARFCARVAGAESLLAGRVARAACYAPAYTIMGGTTQVLRNVIGERILRLPRPS